jgi:hypothetical protein
MIKKVFNKQTYADAADWLRETFPGLSREFPLAVKKLGADRIFDKAKATATYVYDELVPKARDYLVKGIASKKPVTRDVLSNMGYSTGEIDTLMKVPHAELTVLKKPFKSVDAMLQHIDDGLQTVKDGMGKTLSTFERSGKELRATKTMNRAKELLQSEGAMDLQGNLTGRAEDPALSEGLKHVINFYKSLDQSGRYAGMGFKRIGVKDYLRLRDFNQEGITNAKYRFGMKLDSDLPSNRYIYDIDNVFGDEIASQIPGYKSLQDKYAQKVAVRKLAPDLFKDASGNVKLGDTLKKVGMSDNAALKDIWSEAVGRETVEDLEAWRYADEFYNKGKVQGGGRKFGMVESLTRPAYEVVARRAESMRSPESLTGKLRGVVEGAKASKLGQAVGSALEEGAPSLLGKTQLTSPEGRRLVRGKDGFARIGNSEIPKEVQIAYKILQTGVGKKGLTSKDILRAQRILGSQGYGIVKGNLKKMIGLTGIAAAGELASGEAQAKPNIDKNKIESIESSGNANAVSEKGAVGIRQVTQPVVTDFNKSHGTNYKLNDMKDKEKGREISDWYFEEEIPRLLKSAGFEDTEENRLRAYNQGIGSMKKGKYPKETRDYVKKYQKGGSK